MQIDPLSSTSASAAADQTGVRGTKDEFLRLFLAQIQHQDPLDPKNGADMVAQLAQFSAVEQAVQTNQRLGELAAMQTSASASGLADLVDRTVTADATAFAIDGEGGAPPPLELSSSDPIRGATLVVRDANGAEVRRVAIPDGATTVAWDGRNASGVAVPPGAYSASVETASGTPITARFRGTVSAIELTADGPRIRIGGVLLTPSDVRTIASSDNDNDNGVAQ
jgi:flagellar basal-body rod modification protein FlgD